MNYNYAPGYGVIFNYLVSVKGENPNDVDWGFFTNQNRSLLYYLELCDKHKLTNLINNAKLAVATDLIKAGYIEGDKMYGDYTDNLDYFTELSDLSWGAFDNLMLRDDAKYQTVIDFHASLKKEDPIVGHLAGKPFTTLTESDVLDLFLILNPFFFVLSDYIADWTEEPFGKLEFVDNLFYSMLMNYANGKSTITTFNEIVADEHPELVIATEEKDSYIEEFKELIEGKGFYPDITAEKAKELGLIYDIENDEIIIKKCASRNTTLIIPKTIDGVPVKQIKNAIQRSPLSVIVSAVVFADLDYICDYAFSDFPDLASISLLGKVENVGANFAEKTQVDTTEKDGVIYVKININPYYMAVGFNESLANNVHLDKTTKFISSFAFMKAPLKSIIMDGVVSIGKLAFSGCNKLHYVSFSKNLKHIGERAFAMCSGICDIEIDVEEIPYAAFYSCGSLRNFKLGSRVKKIELEAFGGTDVFEFEIPESVISFNSGLFGFDSRITDVRIPGNRRWKNETTGEIYEASELSNPKTAAYIILNSEDAVFTVIGTSDPKEEDDIDSLLASFINPRPCFSEIKASINVNKKPVIIDPEELNLPEEKLHISNEEAKTLGIDVWRNPDKDYFLINSVTTDAPILHIPISIGGETLEVIGQYSLKDNEHIKIVIIHGYLKAIDICFLSNCPNVEYVGIKNGVGEIDYGFLQGNPNLLTEKNGVIYANVNGNPFFVAVESDKEAEAIAVEEDCEIIANETFKNSNVKKVVIPNAKIIGKEAFKNCKNLIEVCVSKDTKILEDCFEDSLSVSVIKH